jgi:hypothetical protein
VEISVRDCGCIAGIVRTRMRYGGNRSIRRVGAKKLFKFKGGKFNVRSYSSTVLFGPLMQGNSIFLFEDYASGCKQKVSFKTIQYVLVITPTCKQIHSYPQTQK